MAVDAVGQTYHVTLRPGHGACCWCGSSFSVCERRLKLVGLPVRKIWRTSFDFWPWIWGAFSLLLLSFTFPLGCACLPHAQTLRPAFMLAQCAAPAEDV